MGVSGPTILSFRSYISTRKYHGGRGSHAGWSFVAYALGDRDLPDAGSWPELRLYLLEGGAEPKLIGAAKIVWRSYLSHLSKGRRATCS